MTDSNEQVSIDRCPLCHGAHSYSLSVERSFVIHMLTMNVPREQHTRRRFKRLFTCPTKDETYEAVITLTESSSAPIQEVTVLGAVG
jgi:hypothetical protein